MIEVTEVVEALHTHEVQKVKEMTKAAKEARRAYKREWARNHPDNVRASQEKYWEKKAAEAAADKQEDGSGKEGDE